MRVESSSSTVSRSAHAAHQDAIGADTSLLRATPPSVHSAGRRTLAAIVILATAAVAVGTSLPASADKGALRARPVIVQGALRYEFDTLTGREWLFDTTGDGEPRNVLASRPAAARRLRQALEAQIGVGSLDELRDAQAPTADALRRLGYL